MGTHRALWVRWPLGITAAVVLLLVVLSPWSGVRADELAVYRPLYLLTEITAISGMVVGSLRAWRTAPAAWTAAIAVVLTTTLHTALSMGLPRSFGYGAHGVGLALAVGVHAVMAVLALAIPMLLLRARLGPRRDREGLIDASAIAATVVLSAAGGSIVVGAVWPAELVKLIAVGLAAGATLHPSALRLGQRAAPTEIGAGISQGRLVVLAGVLLVSACATVVRSWWLAVHLRGSMVAGPPPSALLPSSLAALVVTAAVIWRMWQLLQDREKARQSLRHHATHDDLTGLPNRRALYELLRARVAVTGDGTGQVAPFALLFLDLDGFKAINDTLGHEAGDAVLIEVAVRIRTALRDGDVLTRPSGDEFVAVCDGPIDRGRSGRRPAGATGHPALMRGVGPGGAR